MKIALVCSPEDVPYLGSVKHLLGSGAGHDTTVISQTPEYTIPILNKYDAILCSDEQFLNKLVTKSRHVSLKDYAGSYLTRSSKPCVILSPLAQIYSVPFGKHLIERYITKITCPEKWQNSIPFQWEEVVSEDRFRQLYAIAQSAIAMSIDIETSQEPIPHITLCGYSLILHNTITNNIDLINFTFTIDSEQHYRWMKLLNETTCEVPKIFQNGLYDNSWFIRYGVPVRNWAFDTMDMFHSWYSEMPKRLDFVASYCVKEVWFWKNDSKEDMKQYNCRDVWATSCAWLYLMESMPEWALTNFVMKFPLNFPCILTGARGWKIDETTRSQINGDKLEEVEQPRNFLGTVVGNKSFNPGSPKQVQALLNIISNKAVTSSDEKTLHKVAKQHPLNQLLCDKILGYREAKTLVSRYLNAELTNGRFLYTLSPSGTDTARLSSKSSFLWSGANIQNIPRGSVVKSCFIADDGYFLAEPDASQADARCMAYLSGDINLIETVESDKDYHTLNATKFFGLVWDQITEIIRDLSKRVNHGVNFNMAENTLLETMGAENVILAQQLLQLPKNWSLTKVCNYLIEAYHATYPSVRKDYYPYLVDKIRATRLFTSPLGWTRYFFGDPKNNKHELNALIAHTAQNLTGGIVNIGFHRLWEFERKTNGGIKILCQIHDSIPFQYKIGRLDLAIEAAKLMEFSIPVVDCKGISRMMMLPVGLKAEGSRWSELKKIDMKSWKVAA